MTDVPKVPALTAQEAFDSVARHLLSMTHQSHDGERCRYLNLDGNRCAIGCLIPDDVYSNSMEGTSVFYLIDKFTEFMPWQSIRKLLFALQNVHDDVTCWKGPHPRANMREQLGVVAKAFNLSPFVLDEMESAL